MPGCRQHREVESGADDPLAIGQRRGADAVRGVDRPDRRAGPLVQRARCLGVVEVPMRDEHERHLGRRGEQAVQVGVVGLAGVDHDAPAAPGARNTQVFVPSSVIGPGLSCSRTDAHGVTARSVLVGGVRGHANITWRYGEHGPVRQLDRDGAVRRPP